MEERQALPMLVPLVQAGQQLLMSATWVAQVLQLLLPMVLLILWLVLLGKHPRCRWAWSAWALGFPCSVSVALCVPGVIVHKQQVADTHPSTLPPPSGCLSSSAVMTMRMRSVRLVAPSDTVLYE